MKKWIVALLCLCLLALAGCQEDSTIPTEPTVYTLKVGYGRTDITPAYPMPLQGYDNPSGRVFNNVLDPIHATCIAFSDGETTVLLYQLDLTGSCWGEVFEAKQDISAATGVPLENIMVSVTHTHSAPSFIESINKSRYVEFMCGQMVTAAETAMADLQEAMIYTGSIKTEGLNFTRHYTLADGGVVGDNFGEKDDMVYTGHVGKPDQELQVIRFARNKGKDVVLANFQTHPHRTGGEKREDLSSDIVGPMTTYVEEALDCNFAYFTGASGNINPTSRISSENITANYVEQGQELGRYAYLACSDMEPANYGKVQIMARSYTGEVKKNTRPAMTLNAFSIGDVAFAVVPYEMFSQNGEYVKENSPFQMTFMVTCANSANGYMPAENNFEYGGLESYESTKCYYVPGTAEDLAKVYVQMLDELHNTRSVTMLLTDEPPAKLYWNVDKGAERTANKDGSYDARFICEGQLITLTVGNDELMDRIDREDVLVLAVHEGTVSMVIPMSKMSESILCLDYCVQSMGGTKVKVNSNQWLTGKEIMLDIKDVPVLDVSEVAEVPGTPTTLQKTDLVTAVTDENGDLSYVFVSGREGIFESTMRYCQHCNKDVEFLNWFSSRSLPVTAGHYFLEKDVTLANTQIIGKHDITLDLNGHTVTQTMDGKGIYHMRAGSKLTLLDTVGTGTMIPANTSEDPNHEFKKGMVVRMETDAVELNVYGGTFDATGKTAQHGGLLDNMSGTMNIYGGTFLGGSVYGAGGGTIVVQDRTNIYGGIFQGGHTLETSFITEYFKGGGTVYISNGGVLSLYDAMIEGGISDYDGGCILSNGELRLYGGTISGGTAAGNGGAIAVTNAGSLTVGGKAKISGSFFVGANAAIEITEDCKLKVTKSADGTLNIR